VQQDVLHEVDFSVGLLSRQAFSSSASKSGRLISASTTVGSAKWGYGGGADTVRPP